MKEQKNIQFSGAKYFTQTLTFFSIVLQHAKVFFILEDKKTATSISTPLTVEIAM